MGVSTARIWGHPQNPQGIDTNELRDVLSPGQLFDRYRILALIGRGGMGEVYAAYDPELGRKVALKLLSTTNAQNPNNARVVSLASHPQASATMLMAEARALARLMHEAIVPVFDVGEIEGRVYLAMEFIDGTTVDEWINTHQPSPWQRVELAIQFGRGLAYAHRMDMVHRDIKPDNIMMCAEGRPYILDFGLACFTTHNASETTTPEVTGGTRGYMPPEQYIEGVVDARSDQFAFCVTLYEMLAGCRPRREGSTITATNGDARRSTEDIIWSATIPRTLRPILGRGLALDPSIRFRSIDDLLAQLQTRVDAHRNRWRWRTGVASTTAAALMLVAGWQTRADSPCERADSEAQQVWNSDVATQVQRTLTDSSTPNASYISDQVGPAFEHWFDEWSQLARNNCRRLEDHGAADQRAVDLRRQCLDSALSRARALVTAFRAPSPQLLAQTPQRLAELPDLATCLDDQLLADQSNLPPAAHEAQSVAGIVTNIERIRSAAFRGDLPLGIEICQHTSADTRGLEHHSTAIEFDLACASVYSDATQHNASAELLRRAHLRAISAGFDHWAAEIGAQRTFVEGYAMHRAQATIDELLPSVEAQFSRADMSDSEAAYNLHNSHAASLVVIDEFERAAERFEWLEGFASRNFGTDHEYAVLSRANQGSILVLSGKHLRRARGALISSLASYRNADKLYARRALDVRGNQLILATATGDLD